MRTGRAHLATNKLTLRKRDQQAVELNEPWIWKGGIRFPPFSVMSSSVTPDMPILLTEPNASDECIFAYE